MTKKATGKSIDIFDFSFGTEKEFNFDFIFITGFVFW